MSEEYLSVGRMWVLIENSKYRSSRKQPYNLKWFMHHDLSISETGDSCMLTIRSDFSKFNSGKGTCWQNKAHIPKQGEE